MLKLFDFFARRKKQRELMEKLAAIQRIGSQYAGPDIVYKSRARESTGNKYVYYARGANGMVISVPEDRAIAWAEAHLFGPDETLTDNQRVISNAAKKILYDDD